MFVITLTRDWCDAMAMAKAKRLEGNRRMAAFYLDSAGRIRRSIARWATIEREQKHRLERIDFLQPVTAG